MNELGNQDKDEEEAAPIKDLHEMESALKSLGTQLSDSSLRSSTRILILFSLAFNSRLTFRELLRLTGCGKGSLKNHIEKLEASGLVQSKLIMTFSGSRLTVEITEKGRKAYNDLARAFEKLHQP